ncbi:MAG: nuclear transport factor 2 family protein [Gammaproteobacteria bacterium]|nr:nuclear transport factor 2 family protein [Gammaproteobacteria bacterium]
MNVPAVTCAAVCIAGGMAGMAQEITERQVLDFLDRFEAAQGARDFAAVAPMLHPDALFRFNDGDYRGLEAARGAFESTWALDVEDERYYLDDIDVLHTDEHSATATFKFHWSGVGDNGPFHVVGRGTSVLVRHEGELRLLVEHLSR